MSKRRRVLLWTLGIAICLVGFGFWFQHNLWNSQTIPISSEQVRQITGEDLAWRPEPPKKPLVNLKEVEKLTRGKLSYINLGKTNKEVLSMRTAIEKTLPITMMVEMMISGRQPTPAAIDRNMSDLYFDLSSGMRRAYNAQFRLAVARGDKKLAVDRLLMALKFYHFMRSRQGLELTSTSPLSSMIREGALQHAFSAADLRSIYIAMKPATPVRSVITSLQYEFGCLAELLQTFTPKEMEELCSPLHTTGGAYADESQDKNSKKWTAGQFDKPATLSKMAALYREAIRNAGLPWQRQTWPETTAYQNRLKQIPEGLVVDKGDPAWKVLWDEAKYRLKMKAVPNVLGLIFMRMLMSEDGPQIEITFGFLSRTRWEASRLTLALLIYKAIHGQYPTSLSQLVSLSLPDSVPLDLYGDKPFHYDAKRSVIWSVGENGKGDGGVRGRGPTAI